MVHIPDSRIPPAKPILPLNCPYCNTVAFTGESKKWFEVSKLFVQCASVVCGAKIESEINLYDAIKKWNLRYKG